MLQYTLTGNLSLFVDKNNPLDTALLEYLTK